MQQPLEIYKNLYYNICVIKNKGNESKIHFRNKQKKEVLVMGLDNGITIKTKNDKATRILSDYFVELHLGEDMEDDLCYWRKCHGIRSDIMTALGFVDDGEHFEYDMTIGDLMTVRDVLIPYLAGTDNGWESPIWDRIEMVDIVAESVRSITKLLEVIDVYELSDEDIEIKFYDSY